MAKPRKCISVASAKSLQGNWNSSRASVIDTALGFTDSREFTFDLEDIQEFLNYVKDQSSKQGVIKPGIRIYFGAYNTLSSNKATVFLAPTIGTDSDSDNNYDIDPLNTIIGGTPPKAY